jgi:hypothetical protein
MNYPRSQQTPAFRLTVSETALTSWLDPQDDCELQVGNSRRAELLAIAQRPLLPSASPAGAATASNEAAQSRSTCFRAWHRRWRANDTAIYVVFVSLGGSNA